MKYYVDVVEGMRGEGEGRFSDYWLMEKGEEGGMIIGKNERDRCHGKGRPEELFEEEVEGDADGIGVWYMDEDMRYEALDKKGRKLAA
ncbi:hypothetical protein [Bacillus sp. WP8]|uniref:hypothetical protein n=1 Tax=Bacillus sp. WP8 TaxID=756828 RepID=UPI0011A7D72C|nr:hypothetical protein [Bacillus sp. WP8]